MLLSCPIELDFGLLSRVVLIPSNWRWNINAKTCETTIITGTMVIHKLVLIRNCSLKFFVNGREVFFPLLKNKHWTPFDLQRAIGEFDSQNICAGILDLSLFDQKIGKNILSSTGNMYSLKCKSFCGKEEKQCMYCHLHEEQLKYQKLFQSEMIASLKKKIKSQQRRIHRFSHYRKVIEKIL